MSRFKSVVALIVLSMLVVLARGQDGSTTQPSTQPEVIDVTDFARLKDMVGTEVTVRGKVVEVFVPSSGSISIFNFDGIGRRDFNVVIRKQHLEAVNAGFDGDVAQAVKDRTVSVTGKVTLYRDSPQIQLEAPEQLKIEPAEGEKTE